MADGKQRFEASQFSVLVVDDEESIRSILGEAVGGWGFQVGTAPNGEAAWAHVEAGNLPHVLVTDIRMGGMSGLDLARKVKTFSPDTEVIIMTSHGSLEYALEAMKIGVFDFLTKPFDNIEDVHVVLNHVCDRIYLKQYSNFLTKEVQRKNAQIEGLAEFSRVLSNSLEPKKVLDMGSQGLSNAFGKVPAVVWGCDPASKSLVLASRSDDKIFAGTFPTFPLSAEALKSEASLVTYLGQLKKDPRFVDFLKQASATSPEFFKGPKNEWRTQVFSVRSKPFGIVSLYGNLLHANSLEEWSLLDRYLQTLSVQYDNALMHARAVESSIKDGLTGLYNVRYFKERFERELLLAFRHQIPMCFLFLDVDHFKKYNDQNGHPAGDEVLRTVAKLLRQNFRATEVIARYGGEEFCVLMFHCQMSDALMKAEKFRKAVAEHVFPHGEKQPLGFVSVSIGVAEFPGTATTMKDVIQAADAALYEAKAKSRNVVVQGKPSKGYVAPFKVDPTKLKSH